MKDYSYGVCPYKEVKGEIFVLLNKTSSISNWNFFKGKQENSEGIFDCAIREFQEETGAIVTEDELENYFSQNSKKKFIIIFLVDWKEKSTNFTFDEREIYSTSWVKLNSDIITSKNQQKIMDEIKESLLGFK